MLGIRHIRTRLTRQKRTARPSASSRALEVRESPCLAARSAALDAPHLRKKDRTIGRNGRTQSMWGRGEGGACGADIPPLSLSLQCPFRPIVPYAAPANCMDFFDNGSARRRSVSRGDA